MSCNATMVDYKRLYDEQAAEYRRLVAELVEISRGADTLERIGLAAVDLMARLGGFDPRSRILDPGNNEANKAWTRLIEAVEALKAASDAS